VDENVKTRRIMRFAKQVALLAVAAPMIAACGGLSDFSLKDQEWFARPGKLFTGSSIETPPLNSARAVTEADLMTVDGQCPGMAPPSAPSDANASAEAGTPAPTGSVALGHTECDVVRAIGSAPDSINFSNDPRAERTVMITYLRGTRPGAYTFRGGRLTAIDRVDAPAPVKPAHPAKPKKKSAA
jgi:hypothetical protein